MFMKGIIGDFMSYVNRDAECKKVEESILNSTNNILIKASPASGITTFIKNKMKNFFHNKFKENNVIYINSISNKPLCELLFESIIKSKYLENFQKIANKNFYTSGNSLVISILEGIPYIGPSLKHIFSSNHVPPVYTGAYPTAMEEFFVPFFNEVDCNFLIIIDNIQNLSDCSYDLLLDILQSSKIRCILIEVQQNTQNNKLENYLSTHNLRNIETIYFNRPEIDLIMKLGLSYNMKISCDLARQILEDSNGNINSILSQIRDINRTPQLTTFSEYEKAIILVLYLWKEPLDENRLVKIASSSEVFTFNKETDCKNAISLLKKNEYISEENSKYLITSRNKQDIQKLVNDFPIQLVFKNLIYNFLVENSDDPYSVRLRYNLSKELECTTKEDARIYLNMLLVTGEDISENLIEEIHLNEKCKNDCLLAGIIYCKERNFDEAFRWINFIPQEEIVNEIEAFRVTLLSRVEKSEEAEKALIQYLNNNININHRNFIGSYLISTYIHMERLDDAQEVYKKMKNLYSNEPMFGYLVRNATSAFSGYSETLYEEALSAFKHEKDEFGYATTLCNQGYALCKNGFPEKGFNILQKAKTHLEKFSKIHRHIIYNNLGICYFLLKEYQSAHHFLLAATKLGRNSMPRIFSEINLACVEAVMGKTDSALSRLGIIEDDIKNHKLDRVRQKYYINRLLVEYLSGNKDLTTLICLANKYTDRYFPEHTKKAVQFYKEYINSNSQPQNDKWQQLYSPCGLVYWYIDPLKLFSKIIV